MVDDRAGVISGFIRTTEVSHFNFTSVLLVLIPPLISFSLNIAASRHLYRLC